MARHVLFSFGDTKLGQGRERAIEYLREHGDMLAQIESMVRGAKAEAPLHVQVLAEEQTVEEEMTA